METGFSCCASLIVQQFVFLIFQRKAWVFLLLPDQVSVLLFNDLDDVLVLHNVR